MPLFYLLSQIFLVDNLFLSFYQSILKQSIGIPMDTYWVIFLATTSCPIGLIVQIILLGLILVLQEGLQIICLFLRTLISSTSWIQSKDSISVGTWPKSFCVPSCAFNGVSCNFLDLAKSQDCTAELLAFFTSVLSQNLQVSTWFVCLVDSSV